jgi:hypothetical protein
VVVIVALAIEGLVATFRAVHESPDDLTHAATLLAGTGILLAAWATSSPATASPKRSNQTPWRPPNGRIASWINEPDRRHGKTPLPFRVEFEVFSGWEWIRRKETAIIANFC